MAGGDRGRRDGRGRLGTIDLLPEEADEAIAWCNQALRDRAMPQTEILNRFNAQLADLGIRSISKGAFSRYSIRVAIEMRKMAASRQLTDAVLAHLTPGERSDSTIAATEMLKFRILDMVMNQEEPDPKLLNVASLALSRMSITALRETHGQRLERKDQQAVDDRKRTAEADAARKDGEAGEGAAAAVDPETVLKRIREDVYGIFEK